jgi:hypothetical protein
MEEQLNQSSLVSDACSGVMQELIHYVHIVITKHHAVRLINQSTVVILDCQVDVVEQREFLLVLLLQLSDLVIQLVKLLADSRLQLNDDVHELIRQLMVPLLGHLLALLL